MEQILDRKIGKNTSCHEWQNRNSALYPVETNGMPEPSGKSGEFRTPATSHPSLANL